MQVTKAEIDRVVSVVEDRADDYFEWCSEYEGEGETYAPGYGDHLSLATEILNAIASGDTIEVVG